MSFKIRNTELYTKDLNALPDKKIIINTLNAYSFNLAQDNSRFANSLQNGNVLLPDGISIVIAKRFISGIKLKKIAGADLFQYEMKRLNYINGKCFFLGSTTDTLQKIKDRAAKEFPNVEVHTHSPPFREELDELENIKIIKTINDIKPDVLFVGMTAPKQEIWVYDQASKIVANHICCIGAVFDFYAQTVKRAPQWMIRIGMEWFYRFIREPKRLWRRYLVGNFKFVFLVFKEKLEIN